MHVVDNYTSLHGVFERVNVIYITLYNYLRLISDHISKTLLRCELVGKIQLRLPAPFFVIFFSLALGKSMKL